MTELKSKTTRYPGVHHEYLVQFKYTNDDHFAIMQDLMTQVEMLVPKWVQNLIIRISDEPCRKDDEIIYANINVQYDGRYAILTVFDDFFDQDAATRLSMICHEMCHLYFETTYMTACRLGHLKKDHRQILIDHIEAATTDLEMVLNALVKSNDKPQ